MTLPAHMYRDPAEVYERAEARSCKGCVHERSATLFGTTVRACIKLLPNGKRRHHGRRCQHYDDGENEQ
ncbi:hypothetical protein J5T34_03760 [Cupriavidus gilardii]|uniref:hypothetical protein n=1 Tax=Cupriavidus gilardii TaxID=82541 RepID=UPI001ABE86D7|nr:hypothetical protein [Cupriavidus gilardii]MBO4119855.1 hypothetical protein [Cupriavidus gilardii]